MHDLFNLLSSDLYGYNKNTNFRTSGWIQILIYNGKDVSWKQIETLISAKSISTFDNKKENINALLFHVDCQIGCQQHRLLWIWPTTAIIVFSSLYHKSTRQLMLKTIALLYQLAFAGGDSYATSCYFPINFFSQYSPLDASSYFPIKLFKLTQSQSS